jgi:nucleoside-diphosphate-sugar epimerase
MTIKTIVIFGGSGFVGSVLVKKLTANKMRVKIVTRSKESAKDLTTIAGPDFLSVIEWDYKDQEKLESILLNSDGVVNLVGILAEDKKNSFEEAHVNLTRNLAEKSSKMGIKYFVYNSALAIEKSSDSKYAESKLMAEKALHPPPALFTRRRLAADKAPNSFVAPHRGGFVEILHRVRAHAQACVFKLVARVRRVRGQIISTGSAPAAANAQ